MRILALRGANIASLTDFDIDFRAEPLRSAGLFAIVGPTGSGKSSLLDAMCLALYQKAPRLDDLSIQEGKVETRFGTIAQADIRNLLRRGCDTGFAECDFSGGDGRAYRARWGYRAPKRANAAVQEVMSLVRLDDGQVLVDSSGRKGDYQSRIESLTGLSYGQFTRTILLAQGRFAEFLRGRENERADLLERLTGTGIYTRISVRVRERTAALKLEAEQLELRLEGLSLLTPEEEASLGLEHSRLAAELPLLESRRDALRKLLEAGTRLESLEAGLAAIRTRCLELTGRREADRTELEAARTRLDQALEQRREFLPQWEAARSLDTQREALEGEHRLHREALALARQRHDTQQAQIAALEGEVADLASGLESDAAWIEKHRAKLEPLADNWSLWHERIKQAAGLRQFRRERLPALEALRAGMLDLGQNLSSLTAQRDALGAPSRSSQELTRLLQETQARLESHRRLLPWLECDAEIRERQERLSSWCLERSALETRTPGLESNWELARTLWERTRTLLSQSVSHLRASLVPGEPCPVCGSAEHPWAEGLLQPLDALLEEHALAESTARQALEAHRSLLLERSARIRSEEESLASLRARLAGLSPSPEAMGTLAGTERTPAALNAAIAELDRLAKELLGTLQQAQRHETLSAQVQQLHTQIQAHRTQIEESEERLETAGRELESVLESLDAPFGGRAWRERWEANPEFVPKVENSVADYLKRTQDCETKRRRLEPLQAKLGAEREHLSPQQAAVEKALAEVARSEARRSELTTLRQGLLGGRSVEEAEAAQNSLEEACRSALETLSRRSQQLAQELAGAEGQLKQGEEQAETERAALKTLSLALFPQEDGLRTGELARAEHAELEGRIATGRQDCARLEHRLARQAEQVELGTALRTQLGELRSRLSHWLLLDEQIGSADGKKFRLIAQQFTLEILLEEANAQLRSLAPRYTLKMLGQSMHFGVIDHEGFDELRPVQTLSGGETFLVSLALALGLSRLAGGTVAVESLFIDEGFGTLDSQTLRQVMSALSSLHAQGRKVGLITHVEEMKEQIPVQIRVLKQGQGASRIEVA